MKTSMKDFAELNRRVIDRFYLDIGVESDVSDKYLENNNLIDFFWSLHPSKLDKFEFKKAEQIKLIKVINEISEKTGIPYITMKSFLSYPFIDDDLDVIVLGSYEDFVSELEARGFSHKKDYADYREPLKKMYVNKDFYVCPHIHREVSWNGIVAADKFQFYEKAVSFKLGDETVPVPDPTDELIVAIAHFVFENYYFKLGDFIYIRYLMSQKIDFDRVKVTTKKFGYRMGANLFFQYMNGFAKTFNMPELVTTQFSEGKKKIDPTRPFPYYIPYHSLMPTYLQNLVNSFRFFPRMRVPRRIFTFTVVGYLWKYRLPVKKQRNWDNV